MIAPSSIEAVCLSSSALGGLSMEATSGLLVGPVRHPMFEHLRSLLSVLLNYLEICLGEQSS